MVRFYRDFELMRSEGVFQGKGKFNLGCLGNEEKFEKLVN